jgi:orotidine-5'-phosphate decarboxylase
MKTFADKVAYWAALYNFFIVGLDVEKAHIRGSFQPLEPDFNVRWKKFICHLVDLTASFCCGWKPNMKFYEGSVGRERLEYVCHYIKTNYPNHILICDNKDNDIFNTGVQVMNYYKILKPDFVTVNTLMGYKDSTDLLLSDPNMGVFALCLTSNEGALDYLAQNDLELALRIARCSNELNSWNKNNNYHLVVGGTNKAADIVKIRLDSPNSIFLMPGFGAQGGDMDTINAALDEKGGGFLAVVARHVVAPKLNEGETFDEAVVRQAKYYQHAFAQAAGYTIPANA